MLNEGWATYWHRHIMYQLFQDGLLDQEDHDIFSQYHAAVIAFTPRALNWYRVGLGLFEYVKDRWDKGRFGEDYENCDDASKLANWNTKAQKGQEKIFEIRSNYSDRMAIENFFTDEFIHHQKLYIYEQMINKTTGEVIDVVALDDPQYIRDYLKMGATHYFIPIIRKRTRGMGKSEL